MEITEIAATQSEHMVKVQLARHLRWEHDWTPRKVAVRLGVTFKWIREYVDDWAEDLAG